MVYVRHQLRSSANSRSKGFGTVLFSNEHDAYRAIEMYNGYTWQSRVLDVRLDQQDPHGAIAMANASAQQAQQAAQQSHHAAMQNMANMIGMNAAQAAMAAMQQQGGLHPGAQGGLMPGFQAGPGGPSSPWLAAAMAANANAAAAAAVMQHQQQQRAASPFGGSQSGHLAAGMAAMNLRRPSHDARSVGSGGGDVPHPASTEPKAHSSGGLVSPSATSSSRPGTSGGGSGPTSTATSAVPATASPSAAQSPAGASLSRDSVSPTAARRAPPGTLGQLPPSIFANMSPTQHLPNPPAAAEAAKAAGYKLDEEVANLSPSQTSPGQLSPPQDSSSQFATQQQAPGLGMPGGLVNLYAHNNESGMLQPGGPPGQFMPPPAGQQLGMYRNAPNPAYANRHLFVGNIPFNCQWQDLKDLFRAAGQILRADVSLGPDGRSRGFGTVLFATTDDAMNAVQMFNGYEYQGRHLKVHFDKFAMGQYQSHPSYLSNGGHGMQMPYGQSGSPYGSRGASPQVMHAQIHPAQPHLALGAHPGLQSGLSTYVPGHHQSLSFDDNSSIPGTPIHELNLSNMAAGFPSPGFASPVPQLPRQSSDARRAGFNSDGVAIAPIGSGAPHHHGDEDGLLAHQNAHPPPLSPLSIPPRNMNMGMSIPSPVHGSMFSPMMAGLGPMSPHQGMPLMTPSSMYNVPISIWFRSRLISLSVPGFSFHPFPQTPPLLPQFLSPGLGPFSPPLAGSAGQSLSGPGAGPSGLRHSEVEGDGTPAQSPEAGDGANYFPMMMTPNLITRHLAVQHEGQGNGLDQEAREGEPDEEAGTPRQSHLPVFSPTEEANGEGKDKAEGKNLRRASYLDPKGIKTSLSPPGTANGTVRGVSLDMPRPTLELSSGERQDALRNVSSVADDDDAEAAKRQKDGLSNKAGEEDSKKNEKANATGVKKGPWNLSWLKK